MFKESETRQLGDAIELTAKHIQVHIERHCWQKMFGWCKAADSEVSGMGLARIDGDKFIVYDVFLPKQYCSSGYTELDDSSHSRLRAKLFRAGKDMTHFRFWWHTHYNFNVFWSGTDDKNAEELVRADGEWELSLVINQKGEHKSRADFITNVHPMVRYPAHYWVDNLDVRLIPNSSRRERKRNFKSDIRRWVRPMSELPDSQKPKVPEVIHHPVDNWREERFSGYGGHGYWWEGREDHKSKGVWPHDWRKERDKDEKERQRELAREQKTENKGGAPNGTPFGPYVLYNGLLISPKAWEKIKNDGVEDGGEVPDFCACGNDRCSEGQLCIPCTLCGGRIQAKNGWCPGCDELRKQAETGKCPCPHPGFWNDDCSCGKDCYRCVEDAYMAGGF